MPRPDWDHHRERTWTSAYIKDEIAGSVQVGPTGLEGDEQFDRRSHGGPSMALLAYAADHYPIWRTELDLPEIGPGGFGENLTIDGLDERNICIGDRLTAGSVELSVTQPRGPCANISRRWNRKELLGRVTETRRSGWYLGVPRPGTITAGDRIAVVDRPHPEWTIERVFALRLEPGGDRESIAFLARCPELSEYWRDKFADLERRLAV
jgi:MOSC domain-containing protein YiiM